MKKTSFGDSEVDSPEEIIEGCVKGRKKLISGFGHFRDLNKGRFDESFGKFPSHWAISLSGEPTIYPKLSELVRKLKGNPEVRTVFIVTNGQNPQALSRLAEEDALPTQLYLSLSAPDRETFVKVNRSVHKDGWERLNATIDLLPSLRCRRAIRLTIIRGVNDSDASFQDYAGLIERSKTDFVEIKSYMALGFSRKRLGEKNMLEHDEMKKFTERLSAMLPAYPIRNDDEASRIVLLKRRDSEYQDIIRN
jgi:tRNA wybutosine-synthesizing protein 1